MKKIINTIFSFQKQEASSRLPKILENGTEIYVPLCPDYIVGGIADGISLLMIEALKAAKEIQSIYLKTSFLFLIADTEEDIIKDFNRKPIEVSSNKLESEIKKREITQSKVCLFSQIFFDWHTRQYIFEEKIKKELSFDKKLDYFFNIYQVNRKERYSLQYGRKIDLEETRNLQIRYYAQYLLLQEIMYERNKFVLMNYQTENLRAITKKQSFLPNRQRLELIVY